MKPQTLSNIKKDIKLFEDNFNVLMEQYNPDKRNAHYTACSVLLQNAAFSGKNCVNYNHEEAVNELFRVRKVLEAMKEYHIGDWIVAYAHNELDTIITAHFMSEM